jgi:hypothetical protein
MPSSVKYGFKERFRPIGVLKPKPKNLEARASELSKEPKRSGTRSQAHHGLHLHDEIADLLGLARPSPSSSSLNHGL